MKGSERLHSTVHRFKTFPFASMEKLYLVESYMLEIVVVGGGPVGMFCTFMLGTLGFKKICIVEASDKLGGKCAHLYPEKNVYDVAGFPNIKSAKLVENLIEQMNYFKPTTEVNTKIVKIIKKQVGFDLITNDNRIIPTSKVIFCCGEGLIKPKKPKIPGFEQAEAASAVRYSMSNMEEFRGKKVLIGGGGDSALDWCFSLKGIAKNISLVHRSSLRAMKSSQELLLKMKEVGECDLMMPAALQRIEQNNDKLTAVIETNGEVLLFEFDYFIPCYGAEIDDQLKLSFIKDLDAETYNLGELSNEEFKNKESGIYFVESSKWLTLGFAKAVEVASKASMDAYGEQYIPYSSNNPIFEEK